jgi:hypothetical protein
MLPPVLPLRIALPRVDELRLAELPMLDEPEFAVELPVVEALEDVPLAWP